MDFEALRREATGAAQHAKTRDELEAVRVKYLGKKSELVTVLRSLKDLPLSERKERSSAANALKDELTELMLAKERLLLEHVHASLDVTRPGERVSSGHLHPLTLMYNRVRDIFSSMNFSVVDGPEIETEYYNFEALNIPADHPARDMWDTFWLADGRLLRTHTSPVQMRYMETHEPPFQIIVPGRVFRYEATDVSHEYNFYQVEGLMVGDNVSFAHLKYVIETFFRRLFGPGVALRFRPSYFPFTEPSIEVDIKFTGSTSSPQAGSKWLEMMGAGMVHRNVFDAARYNPRDVRGFAFGVGMDRLAMVKYRIPDIRLFYSGDARFTRQFS